MSFLSGLGLPSSLTSVIGLAVGMYIFKCASSSMDPAMAQWTPQFLAYAGDLIALVASQLAAAYAGVKSIEAAVHFDKGFYYTYAGASQTGDYLGLWELLAVILFLTWSLAISIVGYVEGALLWQRYEAMEAAGLTVGDSAEKLLGFFDDYADDTKTEASDKDSKFDPDGTAIEYDLGFHFVTLLFSYMTISTIAVGAYVFGYMYLGQGDAADAVSA